MDFNEKTVLITGASKGIGSATALAYAQKGAQVILHYRSSEKAVKKVLASLPGEGHFIVQADISKPGHLEQMVESSVAQAGKIDILVNNAGIFEPHPVSDLDFDEWQEAWQRTISINLMGPANLCYLIARQMMKQKGGKIINVSSRGAFRGESRHTAYGAAKAGLNSLSQSLAVELAPHGIHVFVIAPGFVETDMIRPLLNSELGAEMKAQSPLNRVAQPEEIAHAIVSLSTNGMAFSTGAILDMNGASYLRS